jgi:hypothetical protein
MAGTLYKPYVWLESLTTSSSNLYFIVSLPARTTIPVSPTDIIDNAGTRSRTIIYKIRGGTEDNNNIERYHALDASTNYDPALDDIIVQIVEETGKKKGQGSVHHSEGDASGGD